MDYGYVLSFISGGAFVSIIGWLFLRIKVKEAINKATIELSDRKRAISATYRLFEIILESSSIEEMQKKIANIIPQYLGFETGVLGVVNYQKQVLERVAISDTTSGSAAQKTLDIPFQTIEIPLSAKENITIQAILKNKVRTTTSLYDILRPTLSPENAEKVQQAMGTKFSIITPLSARGRVIGVLIVSMGKTEDMVTVYEKEMIERFTEGVGIALDNAYLVEELKKNTEELSKANQQLQKLDKLKDEFISIVSHELRTPMTAIRSYAWMVLHDKTGPLTEKMREYLNRVYISTERLINLVNDMLDVSRIESGRVQLKLATFDMIQLATEVQNEFHARSLERQITVIVDKHGTIFKLSGDREKIHQVFENLVGNAFKFTPSGGTITMDLTEKDGMVQVGIIDTGKGISAEDIKKLFTKFGRLDNSLVSISESSGTGLGLYICKQYIDMHKGRIWVESEVGKGTTFLFTLPIVK